ncbi:phage tail protein, partial [Clostridium botulinum]|nr:phage tail protein [Clostridium botulinum]
KVKGINDLDDYDMKEVIKTVAPKIKDDLPSIIQSVGILPFKTWSWKGDKTYDHFISELKVPFKITILLVKYKGYKGSHDGMVYQTWFDKDIINTSIGDHYIFIPNDTKRVDYYVEPENFNVVDGYGYNFSEFKLKEDKQTIVLNNSNIFGIEIYALGW